MNLKKFFNKKEKAFFKNKMKHLSKIAFAIVALIFLSCSQEDEQELGPKRPIVNSELKNDFENFALMISESLNDENVVHAKRAVKNAINL